LISPIKIKADTISPAYLKNFFETLERTWYDHVQWTPADDEPHAQSSEWTGPVKIAILDSGLDLNHSDFENPAHRRTKVGKRAAKQLPEQPQRQRIKAWRNFVGQPGEEEDVTDESGHGTHLAGIILAIAPRAELYIAKISTGKQLGADSKGAVADMAQRQPRRPMQEALRWAIDLDVDIINLSLGFPYESHDSSPGLAHALEEANHHGIIVFAAAANHGNRHAIAWPACDPELSICVTSGGEFYSPSPFAPTSGGAELPVFITHGEDIVSHWPEGLADPSVNGFRGMSGTSVATSIAAGMAAIIIAFLNKTNAWPPDGKRQWLSHIKERRLRSTRGMRKLLEDMCRDRNGAKILSPLLMWEDDLAAGPLQVLAKMAHAFKLRG
jgi:subtilisin family serine protease